jgi:hypothetical protein
MRKEFQLLSKSLRAYGALNRMERELKQADAAHFEALLECNKLQATVEATEGAKVELEALRATRARLLRLAAQAEVNKAAIARLKSDLDGAWGATSQTKAPQVPSIAEALLTLLSSQKQREAILGDAEEQFHANLKKGYSARRAQCLYWLNLRDLVWPTLKRWGGRGLYIAMGWATARWGRPG